MILAAGELTDSHARDAFETLCQLYWGPVFSFVRRRVYDEEAARDLTQAFFARLLEKRAVKAADPGKGRFRTFLLASLKNFLHNEWERENAKKRGGGNVVSAITPYTDPVDDSTPEKVFERTWALMVLDLAWKQLEQEQASKGSERFQQLQGLVAGFGERRQYRAVAETLDMTEPAVKTAIYRLRKRFGELLREHIFQTVSNPENVEDEIRFLLEALKK